MERLEPNQPQEELFIILYPLLHSRQISADEFIINAHYRISQLIAKCTRNLSLYYPQFYMGARLTSRGRGGGHPSGYIYIFLTHSLLPKGPRH